MTSTIRSATSVGSVVSTALAIEPVARDEGEVVAVDQPARGEALRVVDRHADRDAPPAGRAEPAGDGDERPAA